MVGIFIWLASVLTRTGISAHNVFKDVDKSIKAKNNGDVTYRDSNGYLRYVKTHEIVIEDRDPNTGDWIIYGKGLTPLYNRTKAEREERLAKAKIDNKYTAVYWNDGRGVGCDGIKGYRYKDINTGKLMVIKRIDGHEFFLDIESKQIIRRTDREIALANQVEKNGGQYYRVDWHKTMLDFNTEIQKYIQDEVKESTINFLCSGENYGNDYEDLSRWTLTKNELRIYSKGYKRV